MLCITITYYFMIELHFVFDCNLNVKYFMSRAVPEVYSAWIFNVLRFNVFLSWLSDKTNKWRMIRKGAAIMSSHQSLSDQYSRQTVSIDCSQAEAARKNNMIWPGSHDSMCQTLLLNYWHLARLKTKCWLVQGWGDKKLSFDEALL